MEYLYIGTTIIVLLGLLIMSYLIKQKQNPQLEENNGREPTEEEKRFIDKAMEDYHSNIVIVLSSAVGTAVMHQYRNQALLSQDNEIFVQIEILYEKKPLLTNCYFSGKCEMFYNKKETSFYSFSINNITKGLQELGFENIGFSNIPVTVTAQM